MPIASPDPAPASATLSRVLFTAVRPAAMMPPMPRAGYARLSVRCFSPRPFFLPPPPFFPPFLPFGAFAASFSSPGLSLSSLFVLPGLAIVPPLFTRSRSERYRSCSSFVPFRLGSASLPHLGASIRCIIYRAPAPVRLFIHISRLAWRLIASYCLRWSISDCPVSACLCLPLRS